MNSKTKSSERRIKEQFVAPGLEVRASPINGLGCFAAKPYRKGHKIAEYAGERISRREIKRRLVGAKRIHICAIDMYWAIDGSVGGNGTQYINQSCQPSCDLRINDGHIIFFAVRNIAAGEEITLDYVVSYHDNQTKCDCGAANCRGTINKF